MDKTTRRQWLWFIGLGLGGLAAVAALAYALKLFLRLI